MNLVDVFGGCIRWVYTGRQTLPLRWMYSVDVYGGCIRWMYSAGVFGRCIRWVYTVGVFGHPQGMPLQNINTHRRGGVGPPEYINE